MIRYKSEQQIARIRESCHLLAALFEELCPHVQAGVSTIEIDRWVYEWITKAGGKPAFLGAGDADNPFPASICTSINNQIIHGIPSRRKIASGDLVSLDCGIDLGGYISDQAVTLEIGTVSEEAHRLNTITRECLYKGIEAAVAGSRLHQIGRAVEAHAKPAGYGIVRDYCGHGVGFALHEDPQVSNSPHGGPNPRMNRGLVIAIEPMINQGSAEIDLLDDGWTVVTADGSLSAHWEHTIALFSDHTEILTTLGA